MKCKNETTKERPFRESPEQYFSMAENRITRALADGEISSDDERVIRKFMGRVKLNVNPERFLKIQCQLINARKYFPCDYSQITEDDIFAAFGNLKYSVKGNGAPYRKNTIIDFQKLLKRFFLFLSESGEIGVSEKAISRIKGTGYDKITKTEDDVLTAEEIEKIINAAKTTRYKAFFSLLYESGCRISELARLRWRDVQTKKWGCVLRLENTKTESTKTRSAPIVIYAQFLYSWRSESKFVAPDDFVFSTSSGKEPRYQTLYYRLQCICSDAGVKRITPHLFRHSRITHLIREGMQESIAKNLFWGNASTEMTKTYLHLSQDDVEREILKIGGVEIPEESAKPQAPEARQCSQCHQINIPTALYCSRCGQPLTESAKDDLDVLFGDFKQLFSKITPEKLQELQAVMKDLGNE